MKPTEEAVKDALSTGFQAAFFRDKQVAVAVPDLTRPIDYEHTLAGVLALLDHAGADITVVVGLGLHRPLSAREILPLEALCARFDARLVQHDAAAEDLVELDADVADDEPDWPTLPARFHPAIAQADRVVCVGVVEPHQYAGFSGGAKTVAIGCASAETIGAMHGLEFLRDERTALGRIDDNPFQRALWKLAGPLSPMWGLMVVPHGPEECFDAHFGPLYAAFEASVATACEAFFEAVDAPYDWLHLPVDGPKATNFYQASRAATYAALVDRPAVRKGGLLIVEADCPEGIGEGAGEQACAEAMRRGKDALLAELRGEREAQTRGGQQRAYVLARALEWCDVALVGAERMDELDAMGIGQFGSVDDAIAAYAPGARGRVVGDVFHAIPQTS